MSVAQVISVINQMEADGVVDRYSIGGAVGATFYLEPVATGDFTFQLSPGEFADLRSQLATSKEPSREREKPT